MHMKFKALLHTAAVFAIFFLADSFCQEIIRMVFLVCNSAFLITALYTCLDILNVGFAVFLYTKHVLKMPLSELHLGKPSPALRWYAAGVLLPLTANGISLIFTKGTFHTGYQTQTDLAYILFHDVLSYSLRIAVTEGILFRGLLFYVLKKGFGKKWGIPVCACFYAIANFLFYNNIFVLFEIEAIDPGALLLTFLMGLAFLLITCATGSIWPSVAVHFLYNTFSGSAYLLHIDTHQDFPAVFTYTFDSEHMLLANLPLPSMVVFLALILMALVSLRKKEKHENE